jgi:hypothetical protein
MFKVGDRVYIECISQYGYVVDICDGLHFIKTDHLGNHALFESQIGHVGSTKPTNPKDTIGIKKLSFSCLPWRVLTGVALALMEGAAKYGRHNYRSVGVRASVYFDAVVARHLTDWWEGVDIDPDSGLNHIDKAIAGLMVMRDSMLQGNFVDDRPPRGNVNMEELNNTARAILEKHADKNPKHYTIEDEIK